MSERLPRDNWILLIAIGKVLKTTALTAVGIAALLLVHHDVADELHRWVFVLGIDPGRHLVQSALAHAGFLTDRRLREIGVVTFAYAALFGLEGTGLLLRKVWGEWVSIFITGSFVPLELYETLQHPHVARVITLLVNIAAVAYLVSRVRKQHHAKNAKNAKDAKNETNAQPPAQRTAAGPAGAAEPPGA